MRYAAIRWCGVQVFICATLVLSDSSTGTAVDTTQKTYVTKDGKRLDVEGAKALCAMRALLEGVSARVDAFQDITQKSLTEAREHISHVSSNTHMQEALGKDRMNQTQQYSKMVNHIERRMKSECAISRSHATNASKTLSGVLENHCRADGGHHFRWESSANCDRAAGDIEPLSNRHHANGSGFSISCPPKAVAGYDTEPSFSAMETALRRWNHSKPTPNLTNVLECNDRGVSGSSRHTEPCTVLEAWLRDYEKTRYSIKRLYDITRTAMGMRRYAERLLNDGKQAIEQQKQRERELEEERARQQEAMQREAAAMKALEEAERERLAFLERLAALQREMDHQREAGKGISKETQDELHDIELKEQRAEEHEKELEKGVEAAQESHAKADDRLMFLGTEDDPTTLEEFKKELERELERVEAEARASGEIAEDEAATDDFASSAADSTDGQGKGFSVAWLVMIIAPIILLLLGLLAFILMRGRRAAENKDDIDIGTGTAVGGKEGKVKNIETLDSEI